MWELLEGLGTVEEPAGSQCVVVLKKYFGPPEAKQVLFWAKSSLRSERLRRQCYMRSSVA